MLKIHMDYHHTYLLLWCHTIMINKKTEAGISLIKEWYPQRMWQEKFQLVPWFHLATNRLLVYHGY